jgi:hypothetical protein
MPHLPREYSLAAGVQQIIARVASPVFGGTAPTQLSGLTGDSNRSVL